MLARAPSLSDSLYSPILINPAPTDPFTPKPTKTPRLKYPYPLPILAVLDLVYTIHHRITAIHRPSNHLLALCIFRTLVLVVVLGGSRRWRSRGGWVGVVSVVSLGSVVWEGCKGQLVGRGRGESGGEEIDIAFLVITGLMAVTEYLSFIALLRLSPPSYRIQPFSLRIPNSAIQSPTQFAYSESPASALTRNNSRRGQGHSRYDSITSRLRAHEEEPTEDDISDLGEEDQMEFDDSASVSESEISESSIIDLPPPLEPHRLTLGPSVSLAALDLEASPVIGPLIRRTRSARFSTVKNLGRNAAPAPDAEAEEGQGEGSTGYGTFGMA